MSRGSECRGFNWLKHNWRCTIRWEVHSKDSRNFCLYIFSAGCQPGTSNKQNSVQKNWKRDQTRSIHELVTFNVCVENVLPRIKVSKFASDFTAKCAVSGFSSVISRLRFPIHEPAQDVCRSFCSLYFLFFSVSWYFLYKGISCPNVHHYFMIIGRIMTGKSQQANRLWETQSAQTLRDVRFACVATVTKGFFPSWARTKRELKAPRNFSGTWATSWATRLLAERSSSLTSRYKGSS